jgi:hypothetical protein
MSLRADFDAAKKEKSNNPGRKSNPGFPVVQSIASHHAE